MRLLLILSFLLLEMGSMYPIFMIDVISAPFAPRFSTDMFGLN